MSQQINARLLIMRKGGLDNHPALAYFQVFDKKEPSQAALLGLLKPERQMRLDVCGELGRFRYRTDGSDN